MARAISLSLHARHEPLVGNACHILLVGSAGALRLDATAPNPRVELLIYIRVAGYESEAGRGRSGGRGR